MKTWIAILFTAGALVWSIPALGGEIHTAASRGDVEKVKALLADNPSLVFSKDEHGWTPLYFAAASGHKDVAEVLIANNADVNALNQHFTPLRAAVLYYHKDVADLLIAHNAQVTIFDAAAGGYLDLASAQLNANPGLALATDDGMTPLHFAARNGHKDIAELLIAYKADVNAKNRIGMTPLQEAFAFSASHRPGGNQQGSTHRDYEGLAELLIANGADTTSRNNSGLTALHYVASAGFTNLIRELLDRNADINAKDNSGRTPLDLAILNKCQGAMELLLSRGAQMDKDEEEGLKTLQEAEKRLQVRSPSSTYEYEVDGLVNQTMTRFDGSELYASASFTVYVRDCGWLISTVETNEIGGVVAQEIGSTNGTEIYKISQGISGFGRPLGIIQSNNVPVGQTDSAVAGHLWLMFASRCYWPTLNSDQLVPVYDWQASVAAHGQTRRITADWELLNGPGSLPREVRYLPNAIYSITGTNKVGGMLFPSGFVFKQFQGDRLVKHVEVEVTAVRPLCSRPFLIPLPDKGMTVMDERFDSGVPNRPPSYRNPTSGKWLNVEESRKLAGINTSNDLRFLAQAGISPFPETRPRMRETNTSPPVLSLSIRCTNEVVKAGDEIDIEFRITNNGTNDYKYPDRTYDRSGRRLEYSLVATNSSGNAVPDPRADDKEMWLVGGLFNYATLKPGESFTKVIPLNRWALVKHAGQYSVTGSYIGGDVFSTKSFVIRSEPIEINVMPRTEAEMDAYITSLSNQIAAIPPVKLITSRRMPEDVLVTNSVTDSRLDPLLMKLMYTCDPRIVPTLLTTMKEPASSGFWETEALRFYVPHTEEVKQAIITSATQSGICRGMQTVFSSYSFTNHDDLRPLIERSLAPDNTNAWQAGALMAQQYADDSFTPRLIALATDAHSPARDQAIYALAANRTDESVRALKALLHDPDLRISLTARNAIKTAYRSRGIWQGRPLKPEDFDEKYQRPQPLK